jgi:hypothetical protein
MQLQHVRQIRPSIQCYSNGSCIQQWQQSREESAAAGQSTDAQFTLQIQKFGLVSILGHRHFSHHISYSFVWLVLVDPVAETQSRL